MDANKLISDMKKIDILAQCQCGEEFRIRDALLFDGTKEFPPEALQARDAMKSDLDVRLDDLKKRIKNATEKARLSAESINIGKNVEKIAPEMEEFRKRWALPDCRYLSDPVDLIVFNGLSKSKITSISFVELKSGAARLNAHQKAIKDAIEDRRVGFRVF